MAKPQYKLTRAFRSALARLSDGKMGRRHFDASVDHRLGFVREINQPLLLVSEVQRSGGSLFCDLLDGHSQIHSHPGELKIGILHPQKYHWPKLDLSASPQVWFGQLTSNKIHRYIQDGYRKGSKSKTDHLPFVYSPELQEAIFLQQISKHHPRTQREILDCYITSYFNAWIDYRGLYRDPATIKYWAAMAPRLTFKKEHCAGFFADYPNGFLVSIVRNPRAWFASAKRHEARTYGEVTASIDLWVESTAAALRNSADYPGRVLLLHFDDLIQNTEASMKKLCAATGLDFEASLVSPSFNGLPLRPNTSFPGHEAKAGTIIKDTIHRGSDLTEEESTYIQEKTTDLFNAAMEVIQRGESGNQSHSARSPIASHS